MGTRITGIWLLPLGEQFPGDDRTDRGFIQAHRSGTARARPVDGCRAMRACRGVSRFGARDREEPVVPMLWAQYAGNDETAGLVGLQNSLNRSDETRDVQ